MLTGNSLLDTLMDELNELGLPNMAAELIFSEYRDKISKRINNRLRSAKLIGCSAEIGNCTDSKER